MSWVIYFVEQFLSGGWLVILSLVCGVHYILTLFRFSDNQRRLSELQQDYCQLEVELTVADEFKKIATLENSLLREFVSQSNLRRAVQQLLKRYIPDPDRAFGILLECRERSVTLQQVRGLSESSEGNFVLDAKLVDQIRCQGSQKISRKELCKTEFFNRLSPSDRQKISHLYFVALGDGSQLTGLFLTTSLYPVQAPEFHRMEVARRLMTSASTRWTELQEFEKTECELRSTNEILELRSITDQNFSHPYKMLERFLETLQHKVGSERAMLILAGSSMEEGSMEEDGTEDLILRCGPGLSPGIVKRWGEHEARLVKVGKAYPGVKSYSFAELETLGVDSLMGAAVTAPLVQHGVFIGLFCMMRTESTPFAHDQVRLVKWSAEYLSETILRTINQANIERLAKHDGLTGLANRRTFDQMIKQEIHRASDAGSECSLILFDLDHFKSVNDTWGHQVGDDALKMFAAVLDSEIQKIRSSDRALVARYGGEEMAVLLPGIGMAGAMRIGESMRKALEDRVFALPGHSLKITASGGVATFPNHSTDRSWCDLRSRQSALCS